MAAANIRDTEVGIRLLTTPSGHTRVTEAGVRIATKLGGTARMTLTGLRLITPQQAAHFRITECGLRIIVQESPFSPPQNTYVCAIDASSTPVTLGGN